MNRVVIQSVRDVDVVLFVVETTHFDDRDALVMRLLPINKPVILVVNKIDRLAEKSRLLPFLAIMNEKFLFTAIVPVSAEKDLQLLELINVIRPYLPENPPLFGENEITDRSERFIAAELVREKLFRLMGEEIPYSISVAIDQFIIEGDLRKIYVSIIVEKGSQKSIIIGKNGEKLKVIATQARKSMEEFFESRVYLEVWVKIRSGWADDAQALKSLGYE